MINQKLNQDKLGLDLKFLQKINKKLTNMISRKSKAKRIIVSVMMAALLLVQNPVVLALAQTAPEPPSAPTAPTPPPQSEETPTPPSEPTPPPEPTPPSTPTYEEATNPAPPPTWPADDQEESGSDSNWEGTSNDSLPQQSSYEGSGGQGSDGQSGSATINTGDADNVGNISTTANTNISAGPSISEPGGGITVANSGNGSESTNSGSVSTSTTNNNLQNNSANVGNNLYQNTVTGDNSASKNTGGDQLITTGDANTTGTILNSVNTNLDGVTVYEFNVADDHIGDYVLDLANATCISGCIPGDITVKNYGNSADSDNTGIVDSTINNNTFQTNDAVIENNMNLTSDSGDNKADMNTGGDSTIVTGDANVSGSVVNMVNNNIVGSVVYAVVNIFGNLVGDIVLPDGTVLSCCVSNVTAANIGNGADSVNSADVDQSTNNTIYQFNNADIQNNLYLEAETGDNDVNKNTGGSSSVTTGDANIVAQVLNVANTNIIGGTWWLVLVNEAGRWIGKIVGSPDGQNYAGSSGFEFVVDENGEITAVNSENVAGSSNAANASQATNSTTQQSNNAAIVNNVNLSAKTGDNSASMNGGNNSVTTGDANVIASIVNFVNNNIVGGGKLFVTVINVFGSWLGDFVGPGQTKEASTQNTGGIGGASAQESNSNSSNNSNNPSQSSTGSSQTSNASEQALVPTSGSGSLASTNILGIFSNASTSEGDPEEGEGNVAFASQREEVTQAAGNVIKINLAWLLTLVPVLLIYVGFKKRKLILSHLPSKVR